MDAVVEYEYLAQEPDELTLRKGDIITNIKSQPGGWWEGTLRGKRGMFPDNFVKICSNTSNMTEDISIRNKPGRQCKVLFSYQPVNEDELELKVNEVVEILGEVEEGWWKGKCGNTVGVFPSNFVMEITEKTDSAKNAKSTKRNDTDCSDSLPTKPLNKSGTPRLPDSSDKCPDNSDKCDPESRVPSLPPKPVKELCRVLYSYSAANDDELSIKEGDIITLLSKDVQDKGWWRGELRGRVGLFPDNFVEVVVQDELSKKPERPPPKSLVSTTNKVRDSITKPAVSTNAKVDIPPHSSTEGLTKTEDKIPAPPVPVKKPSLFPPVKKSIPSVQLNNEIAVNQDLPVSKCNDIPDGSTFSRSSYNVSKYSEKSGSKPEEKGIPESQNIVNMTKTANDFDRADVEEFDHIERSAMLSHPTASRAKAPRRRPPTSARETESSSDIINGNSEDPTQLANHEDDETEEQGVKNRIWKKNKAPWMEELKLNQARKSIPPSTGVKVPNLKSPPSPPFSAPTRNEGPTAANNKSVPVSYRNKTEESHAIVKHARPKSGTEDIPMNSNNDISSAKFSGVSTKQFDSRPHSVHSDVIHVPSHSRLNFKTDTSTEAELSVNDTNKVVTGSSKVSAPSSPSSTFTGKLDSSSSHTQTGSTPQKELEVTVSYKEYMELKYMVLKLEQQMEQQREEFTKELKNLSSKLKEEIDTRFQMQQDLDKLTNLVTQV